MKTLQLTRWIRLGASGLATGLARAIWAPRWPIAVRGALLALVMARTPRPGWISRKLDGLARRFAIAGGEALMRDAASVLSFVDALRARGAAPLLLAGDSHSRLLCQRDRRGGRWLLPLHHLATGASARALGRASSRSGEGGTLRRLFRELSEAGADLPAVLMFGQVDVEFVFLFKRLRLAAPADKEENDFNDFCRETVSAYTDFAAALPRRGGAPALASIFPPALSDEAWRNGYLNAHIADVHGGVETDVLRSLLSAQPVTPLPVRTARHLAFNADLRTAAVARGLGFVDIAGLLPMGDGVAAPHLCGSAAGRDHHLDPAEVRPAVVAGLWAAIPSDLTGTSPDG